METHTVLRTQRLPRFAWILLAYNIFVVLWGAYVRATGSGAGCGAHWPLCNGEVIPRSPQIETMIELTHRLTSGLALIGVLLFTYMVWKQYSPKSLLRISSGFVLGFTLSEALIGAVLVLFELVAYNTSNVRIFSIVAHLINTFLLLAALFISAWWLTVGSPEKIKLVFHTHWRILFILFGVLVVGASGAITALGDTLFPAESLYSGLKQDFESGSHILLRLRVLHPLIAVLVGGSVLLYASVYQKKAFSPLAISLLRYLVIAQLFLGVVNVILLAPVWMQIVHLLFSIFVWLVLVCIFIESIRVK